MIQITAESYSFIYDIKTASTKCDTDTQEIEDQSKTVYLLTIVQRLLIVDAKERVSDWGALHSSVKTGKAIVTLVERVTKKSVFCKVENRSPSWERGLNENTNKLLRQYYPKGSDFSHIDESQLNMIMKELNDRPRKDLDYLTPDEAFDLVFDGN